ncbi:putative pre-mRNA-splicing factor ATP-dependent RNA helicase [Platanthera zijinensis]|uniref:RNA helicase n=1 Tax=Platanthera zijinensis TaxID=2320716 RepID=A0AAP0AVE1_9ASPA
MPFASFIRVCLGMRTRMTMTFAPSPTLGAPSISSRSRRNPKSGAIPMKAGIYIPPIPRLRSVIASANGAVVTTPPRFTDYDWRNSMQEANGFTNYRQQSSHYSRHAYKDYSEDDSDHDLDVSSTAGKGTSTLDNVDEWKWKFSMLLRNDTDQELVSRERKDRRDYEHIAIIAERMRLYSHQYAKVVVFSKVPLPNYRPDLDDKRPQREVSIPIGLQREVDSLLTDYLSRKSANLKSFPNTTFSRSSSADSLTTDEGFFEQQDTQNFSPIMREKLLRRSLQLRNQQSTWQESLDGQKMIEFRKSLPSYKEKEALLQAISLNQVVVISGETGCGKTTQLPQYVLESEIDAARGATCSIICTQPRRISAMTVAERVAAERGEKLGESVGYKVRLEGIKGRDTRILFCTTGILLRRLLVDRSLKGVTHVFVDEIHERGMNEDFLLIVLKDLLPRRPELKLILMSATLNAELFSSYFAGAPMVHIPGFTYPVRTHFLENILEITGHRLTPYNQIDDYGQEKSWKMQKQALRKRKSQIASSVEEALEAADFRDYSSRTRESLACWNPDSIGFNLIESVLVHICQKERPGAILVFMTGWDDINSLKEQLQSHPILGDPIKVLILPCHGSMASSEQRLIFDKPENGARKIVLATNMAETSITINDVIFVVDCGKAKETSYDALNNTPCLLPTWISKASARQRRGRAGRVQPGECYHLYPRCVYEVFSDYQLPELQRTPLQSLCLQIKILRLGSISEFLSRALQSPEALSVQNAIEYLKVIGALDEEEELTILGRHLAILPVEPKLGKMLIFGAIFKCLDPILTVVAGLSVRDPFLTPFDKRDLADSAKSQFSCQDYSDHLALIRAYEGWKDAEKARTGYEYCWKNFLSPQTLKAIYSLRNQFHFLLKDTGLVDESIAPCNIWYRDENLVRAVICAGLFPGICSVVNKERSITLKTMEDGQVMLYSSSVNGKETKIPYPWLVFNEKVKVNSVFLRDSTAVSDSILLLFGGKICRGGLDGHLKMLAGYLEFFMKPELAYTYVTLKKELEELILNKLQNPRMDIQTGGELLQAIHLLVTEDPCSGQFVFGRQELRPKKMKSLLESTTESGCGGGGDNPKSQLQTILTRAGHGNPSYRMKQLKNQQFRAMVMFNGMEFIGQPCMNKKQAEKNAASEALEWLIGGASSGSRELEHLSLGLKKSKKQHHRRA